MPSEIDKVVKNFIYKTGAQYTDYKSGDKVAAYGVGALVAGSLGIKGSPRRELLQHWLPLQRNFGSLSYCHLFFCLGL